MKNNRKCYISVRKNYNMSNIIQSLKFGNLFRFMKVTLYKCVKNFYIFRSYSTCTQLYLQ